MKPINPNLWPREIGNGCLCEFPPDELDFRHQFDFLQLSALTHSLSCSPDGGTTKCRTLINPSWLPPSSQNCSQRKTKLPSPPSPTSVGSLKLRSIPGQKRPRLADYPVTTINRNYCRSLTCKLWQVKLKISSMVDHWSPVYICASFVKRFLVCLL